MLLFLIRYQGRAYRIKEECFTDKYVDSKSHITECFPLCVRVSSSGYFILLMTREGSFLSCPLDTFYICSSACSACFFLGCLLFISLFLACHGGGHSAHCRVSRREVTQRQPFSSLDLETWFLRRLLGLCLHMTTKML